MSKKQRFLTTGQAAAICSVTPDTVLKWIRSGVLRAKRTPGGHHRIDRKDLDQIFGPADYAPARVSESLARYGFMFCWDYHGHGEIRDQCLDCAVFQMRAQRCYEVIRLAPESQHQRVFCSETCEQCGYYSEVKGQCTNVLVVTNDPSLYEDFQANSASAAFNLRITDCEYGCSATISDFKPDFVFIDCSVGLQESQDICCHLSEDPRIPFVRVVLAGEEDGFPKECEKGPFARISRPFTIRDIVHCIEATGEGGWVKSNLDKEEKLQGIRH